MSNATNLRVRHSDVSNVIPLHQEKEGQTAFGLLYQKIEHIQVNGKPCQQIRREFEKLIYDRVREELVSTDERIQFPTNTTYKAIPMEFGGFLVFDIDMIAYCKGDLSQKALFYRKLRSPFTVTAFCAIDEYNAKTHRTKQGSNFMRYLFATETGELFMLAF